MPQRSKANQHGQTEDGHAWLTDVALSDPHPSAEADGWPEFKIALTFYVNSDDPAVMARERRGMFDRINAAIAESLPESFL